MPKEYKGYINPEWEEKHEKSIIACMSLNTRPLLCPRCGFNNGKICEDLRMGHLIIACRKCKMEIKVDTASFKRDADFKRKTQR